MKLQEGKHNHNLTNLLKVCLFGLVMLLPFIAILPSTLYFAFNEHAQNYTHEEVIETYEYETNNVYSVNDLVVGNIYKINIDNFTYPNENLSIYNTFIYKLNINGNVNLENITYSVASYNTNTELRLYLNASIVSIQKYDNATYTNSIFYENYTNLELDCYFVYKSGLTNTYISYVSASDYLGEKNVEVVSSEQSPLKAFYSASNELWQQPMFSWVNTGLGSIAIANMLSVFGIAQNTFISNILIYWLSITAIYIIIDIVITAFTILTHLLMKKAE